MKISVIRAALFRQGDDLVRYIVDSVPRVSVKEKMVLAVTSKIVSLAEGRLLSRVGVSKEEVVRQEADRFYGEMGYGSFLTLKHGLLIASAGVDESNSETGDFILYPQDPFSSAQNLWFQLCAEWKLKNLGIILTDSHTSPMRRGVTGIALSYWGFRGVISKIGESDLFGRELKMTQVNVVDALVSGAVLCMGEGGESRPLAIIDFEGLEFCETVSQNEATVPIEDDLYMGAFGLR